MSQDRPSQGQLNRDRPSLERLRDSGQRIAIFDRETELSEQMGSFGAIRDSDYDIVRDLD